jgi:O-acetyl-ADP-ribose deacetylase (regulator of RNase III)
MIQYKLGNLTHAKQQATVLDVNLEGVIDHMEVLRLEKIFPSFYKDYSTLCARKQLQVGNVALYQNHHLEYPHYLIHFPTSTGYGMRSRIEYIEKGVHSLIQLIDTYNIQSIAIPQLGVVRGGLDWQDVKNVMVQEFTPLKGVDIVLYEPDQPYIFPEIY